MGPSVPEHTGSTGIAISVQDIQYEYTRTGTMRTVIQCDSDNILGTGYYCTEYRSTSKA